jgi:hypothetical protein
MEYRLAPGKHRFQGRYIREVGADRNTTSSRDYVVGLRATRERAHFVAGCSQLVQQMSTQKSACAGQEYGGHVRRGGFAPSQRL